MNTVDVGGIAGAGCALGVEGKKKKQSTYSDEQSWFGLRYGWIWWVVVDVTGSGWLRMGGGGGWMRMDVIGSDCVKCKSV